MDKELLNQCLECKLCDLSLNRKNVVFGSGNSKANLMLIGEAPGVQEDETGLPFVGRSGLLLKELVKNVGIDIQHDCYITNLVKCRPPVNRRPSRDELQACSPFLQKQIELVNPQLILLIGATAAEAILGFKGRLSDIRGNWIRWQGTLAMPIFHPSYLLRNPSMAHGSPRFLTLNDLRSLRDRLK